MTLKETLKKDFIENYKAQNKDAVAVLRAVNGAITTEEKSGKASTEFGDAQVLALIAREVKKRKASAEEYEKVGATERAEREAWEAKFLMAYLPEQLSADEIRTVVQGIVLDFPDANTGLIMKGVMSKLKGKADGRLVKQIVDEELAKVKLPE